MSMEPGIITRGIVLREEHLKVLFGIEDWRTLRDRLEAVGVRGKQIGKHRWYSTTMISRGMERLILDEQKEED